MGTLVVGAGVWTPGVGLESLEALGLVANPIPKPTPSITRAENTSTAITILRSLGLQDNNSPRYFNILFNA